MARLVLNDLVEGFSGTIGKIVFKQYYGKTYIARKAAKPTKQSEQQRNNRLKFKMATEYARKMMNDDAMKSYYKKMATQLELPNAYTAAITDYMRKPKITHIDTTKYSPKPGGRIHIIAGKKDFSLASVNVIISSPDSEVIETGPAHYEGAGQWIFSSLTSPSHYTSYIIMVMVKDRAGSSDEMTISV